MERGREGGRGEGEREGEAETPMFITRGASKFPFNPEWEPWVLGSCGHALRARAWPGTVSESTEVTRVSLCQRMGPTFRPERGAPGGGALPVAGWGQGWSMAGRSERPEYSRPFANVGGFTGTQLWLTTCHLRVSLALMPRKRRNALPKRIKHAGPLVCDITPLLSSLRSEVCDRKANLLLRPRCFSSSQSPPCHS